MAAVRDQAASASNTSPASGAPSPVGLDETSFLAAIAVHPSMLATRDLRVIDQLSAVLNRAWRTIFSGRSSTAWDNALVRQSGLRLPPYGWYRYPVCLSGMASGAYPGDKLGVTRRIWYTWTDEHVYKTAGQGTCRHPAIRPGVVS
jgi:hypothetical protein